MSGEAEAEAEAEGQGEVSLRVPALLLGEVVRGLGVITRYRACCSSARWCPRGAN